jgi:peptidoglycan/xylan/chitin deacetylase (PgdA/CDA1 family)
MATGSSRPVAPQAPLPVPSLVARAAAAGAWAYDLLTDPRRPHQIPFTLWRLDRRAHGPPLPIDRAALRPAVLISFDIERDSDQPPESAVSQTAGPFLEAYLDAVSARDYQATFYVQGAMVEGLAPQLRRAWAAGHEVGLHGYYHELWGARNWITRRVPPTPTLRRALLRRALEAFEAAGLPRPVAFRAPNLTIDRHTYAMLRDLGFRTDSSTPTQRGLSRPPRDTGLTLIPISVAPMPSIYRNPALGLPTALHFFHFNYTNSVDSDEAVFRARVDELLAWQVTAGMPPELVLYAHNWEFFDLLAQPVALGRGLAALVARLDWLAATYGARFYTMAEWARLRPPAAA